MIKDEEGFTLIEVVVALMVMSIILLPTLGLIKASFINSITASKGIEAMGYAQGLMEDYSSRGEQDLVLLSQQQLPIVKDIGGYIAKITINIVHNHQTPSYSTIYRSEGVRILQNSIEIIVGIYTKSDSKEVIKLHYIKVIA